MSTENNNHIQYTQNPLSSDVAFITLSQIQKDLNQFTQALIDIASTLKNLSAASNTIGGDVRNIPNLIDNCDKINNLLSDLKLSINNYEISMTKASSEREILKNSLNDIKRLFNGHSNLLQDITKGVSEHNHDSSRINQILEQNAQTVDIKISALVNLPDEIKLLRIAYEKLDKRLFKFMTILATLQGLVLFLYGVLQFFVGKH